MSISFIKQEKNYRRLFFAGVVNGIGDRFSSVAVLAMLLQLTGSGLAVGMTLAIRLLPFVIFAPIGGRLADRFSKKTMMVATDLVRILFALSFLFVHSKDDLWIVYVSTFMLAAGEAIYGPVRKSAIPQLVSKEHLLRVNSLEQVLIGIVLIVGAFSGGIVAYLFGAGWTFWINAVSFLGAAAIISTITFPEKKASQKEAIEIHKEKLLPTFKKVILMSIPVQILLFCSIVASSLNGIDNVLISVYAVKEYHLGDVGVGLFYGALGIGLALSFVVVNRLRKHILGIGLVCLLLEGTFHVVISQTGHVTAAFFLFCGAALMSGIGNACFDTVLMKEIPEEHQGTMFGLLEAVTNPLLGVSMFLSGVALDYLTPRSLGLLGGIGYMLIAIFLIAILSTRRIRERETA
ncbi:MFS transporter [Neobacillus niacini]|uniref:MFS transporter n=1 Tax=Neobacillus niacini TaxID=86668 RepID=UPI0021CAF387|nr:MFS transporter [Neobacillus niacini]MCM3766982.1 MFS transporter [Neobacillus niacini]